MSMEGYLKKWTNVITRWKTRYIVIENNILKYYSKNKHNLKGTYYLLNSLVETSSIDSNDIIIKLANGDILRFQTPSLELKQKWFKCFLVSSVPKKDETIYQTNPSDKVKDVNDIKKTFKEILSSNLDNKSSQINLIISQTQISINELDKKIRELNIEAEKLKSHSISKISQQIIEIIINLKTQFLNCSLEIQETKETLSSSIIFTLSTIDQLIESKKPNTNIISFSKNKNINNTNNIEEQTDRLLPYNEEHNTENKLNKSASDDIFVDAEEFSNEFLEIQSVEPIFRNSLPVKASSSENYSLWNELKFYDLTLFHTINFDVSIYFNEPLTMLQRLAESMETAFLLIKASNEKDSMSRLMYVSLFCISQYNSLFLRNKRPFNSLLGETYEFSTENYKLVAEHVSYNPSILALYVEGKNFIIQSQTQILNQLKQASIEFKQLGEMSITLLPYNEIYKIKRPSIFVCNITIGKLYLDVGNESIIENMITNEKAVIHFHQQNWFDKAYGLCDGLIKDKKGVNKYEIKGKWNEFLTVTNLKTLESFKLWESTPRPANSQDYFNFSLTTFQLNFVSEGLSKKLPPSDSRFRKDIRLLENGDITASSKNKQLLEEMEIKGLKILKIIILNIFHYILTRS